LHGVQRRINALRQNFKNRGGDADHRTGREAWGLDVEGAAAEMAVAKGLNRFMPFIINTSTAKDDDLNGIHVRSTPYAQGHLLIYKDDFDEKPYVLAVGAIPRFNLKGFCLGKDGKQQKYFRQTLDGNAFWVPQDQLKSIERLMF